MRNFLTNGNVSKYAGMLIFIVGALSVFFIKISTGYPLYLMVAGIGNMVTGLVFYPNKN